MPSIISDFLEPVKKMSSEVLIANNQSNNENNYNIIKNNLYRRTITIDNTAKTAKSNYTISFVIDHQAWWRANKTAFNFCDLRVYDSDGVTLLNHEAQSYCTSYCLISVLVPSILSNSSKNIFIEYGNPALINLSQNIWGGAFTLNSLIVNYRANEANKVFGGGLENNQEITTLQNIVKNNKIMVQNNGIQAPLLITNQINGLPVMRFDGINDYLSPTIVESTLDNLTEFSLFFVAKASSVANYRSIIRYQNTGGANFTVFPFSDGKFILSADGGTATGVQLNPNAGAFCLGNGNWKKNTTNGFNTYLNGVLQNQRNSANVNNASQRLGIGSFSDGNSDFFNGDLAEILIFTKYLTALERQEVENYLNTKYRIYNTSDMPTISVGNETNITSNYDYISYAPVAEWNSTSEFSTSIFGSQTTKAKVNISNIFESTIVAGVNQESWSNSIQYYNDQIQESPINLNFSRKQTISPSTLLGSVNIRAIDSNNSNLNINSLDNFCLYNEVNNTYLNYISDDNDYISLYFACQDANNINLTNSFLRFQSVGNTTTFTASLTLNESPIETGINNKIRIKKSLFTKTGTQNWADMATFRVNFVTNTSVQDVYYGNLQLIRNIEEKKEYKKGSKYILANAVSSDNGTTYYTHNIHNVIVDSSLLNEDISMECLDYLDLVKNLKMSELSSFTGDAITFNSQLELASYVPDHKIKFYTYFVQKLLGFVFPSTMLDVNLDLLSIEDQSNDVVALNYFNISENDIFGDILDELLLSCAGTIVYDSITKKYIARNIYNNLDQTIYSTSGLQLATPYQVLTSIIDEYTEDTRSNDNIYNYIKLVATADNYFEKRGIIESDALNYRLNSLSTTTFFVDVEQDNIKFCSNLQVGEWFVASQANSDSYNNAGIVVDNVFYANGKIGVSFVNSNSSDRFVRKLEIIADILSFNNIENYFTGSSLITKPEFNLIINDQDSINKNNKKEYEISYKYQYVYFDSVANDGSIKCANIYQAIINNLKNEKEMIEIKLNFDPHIRLGQVIQVRNKTGKIITGFVTNVDQNSSPPDFDTTIKLKEI